jgi:hypothetical protein
MASHTCPFCREAFGCRHLVGEGDQQIEWFWDVIGELKRLSDEADMMKVDIGAVARGIRGFEDLTPETQRWYDDWVPDVIVGARGIHLHTDCYDFGGPANGVWYGVFVDPKQRRAIEKEYDELLRRLHEVTRPKGLVS